MSMNTISKLLLSAVLPIAALAVDVPAAEAQARVVVYPSSAYVASYEPIYYNGSAHYFYNNHWYYRDHGAWRGYEHEPAELWGRRGEWAGRRHRWR
jgi:hypothetical protein